MFFRRKRRNKRDPVLDDQNIPPNDVRERRGSRRGSIVGRIWRSMRIKRRAPLPDVRQPEVFSQPRHRSSDPNAPMPNNIEIIQRRDDSTLDKILGSRMKSYNVPADVNNSGVSPIVTRVTPSAEEITISRIRGHAITNNVALESNELRLPLSNPERRRSASADRNRRHEENRIQHQLRQSQRGSSNIERPRSHDYEGQRQNNRLPVPINNRLNQERPVSDSRLLERYFRQHESRSRALQPNDRNSRSRSAEANSVTCRQPLPLISLAETSERQPERDNREQRTFYHSREHRINNNYRNNISQRENIYRHVIPNEYETTNEPAQRIYEGIRELRVTNGISREQQNGTEIFQENNGHFHRNLNETRDLRIAARELRTPVINSNDYRIFAQSTREYNPIEINRDNNRTVDLPREYRPVEELGDEFGEIHDSYAFNQHNNVFYHENLRLDPPPYDEAVNRQYTTTLRSRPPSYSHVVEEIMNERLMMSSNVYSVRNPPTRLRHNTPLAIRS